LIPYGRHIIDDNDISEVIRVLKSDFLTTGPSIKEFEVALCKKTNAKHAIVCSSGTAALHLAALTLDLSEGDAVIVPSITFISSANAFRFVGAEILFADVNPNTGLSEVKHYEDVLNKNYESNVKAIVAVDLNGHSADLESIANFAKKNNLKFIVDSSHSLGSQYLDKKGINYMSGSNIHADLTCFSFHAVKTIAMGEGGAITTNNKRIAKRLYALRSHGITRSSEEFLYHDQALDNAGGVNPWYYEMHELGFNYRATDIQCALGLSQLKKIDDFIKIRRNLVKHYEKLLSPFQEIVEPVSLNATYLTAWHLFPVLIDFKKAGILKSDLIKELFDQGIGTQVHYIPIYRQPYYKKLYGNIFLPGAENYYEKVLSLPLYPSLDEDNVAEVVEKLCRIIFKEAYE